MNTLRYSVNMCSSYSTQCRCEHKITVETVDVQGNFTRIWGDRWIFLSLLKKKRRWWAFLTRVEVFRVQVQVQERSVETWTPRDTLNLRPVHLIKLIFSLLKQTKWWIFLIQTSLVKLPVRWYESWWHQSVSLSCDWLSVFRYRQQSHQTYTGHCGPDAHTEHARESRRQQRLRRALVSFYIF